MSKLVKIFGPPDIDSVAQMRRCIDAEDDAIGVLMADHHKGYSMPIGGVVAYKDHLSPSGVGYDIGCGNLYAETNIFAQTVDIPKVMTEISKVISFGMGQKNTEKVKDHPVFDSLAHLKPLIGSQNTDALVAKGRNQLGTVGSGNHYVDLFENRTTGHLGVGVHFGSRGVGHTLAKGYMALAAGLNYGDAYKDGGMDAPPLMLSRYLPSGQNYETAMNIALEYANAGRTWVVNRIVYGILGATVQWQVHNNHNYAAREFHHNERQGYLVHRKGATPAFPGQHGFVGATMGEDAVIVKGISTAAAAEALFSTVHGAGRLMSRNEAKGKEKINKYWTCMNYRTCSHSVPANELKRGKQNEHPLCTMCGGKMDLRPKVTSVTVGKIDWPKVRQEIADRGIVLIGGDADEAPGAYKRLPEVLGYHSDAIQVLHYLRPLGVAMASKEVRDDYKD